jgi:hypothetical protein
MVPDHLVLKIIDQIKPFDIRIPTVCRQRLSRYFFRIGFFFFLLVCGIFTACSQTKDQKGE